MHINHGPSQSITSPAALSSQHASCTVQKLISHEFPMSSSALRAAVTKQASRQPDAPSQRQGLTQRRLTVIADLQTQPRQTQDGSSLPIDYHAASLAELRGRFGLSIAHPGARFADQGSLTRWRASWQQGPSGLVGAAPVQRTHRRAQPTGSKTFLGGGAAFQCNSWDEYYSHLTHLQHADQGPRAPIQQSIQEQLPSWGRPPGWSRRLEVDIMAVAQEAGLPEGSALAVLDAARKGRLPDNPGVLLSLILDAVCTLEPMLGGRAVNQLLRAQPTLMLSSGETLGWHFSELVDMFGAQEAASMVCRNPGLLAQPPVAVWATLEALTSALGISLDRSQALVARQPRLLSLGPAELHQRAADLQDALRLQRPKLLQLICSQPALLTYQPATLAANLDAMAASLGSTTEVAAGLIARCPSLVMLSPLTFDQKLQALRTILQLQSVDQAAAMVVRQPTLLSLSSQLLEAKLAQLGQALGGASPEQACATAASMPALLTLGLGTLERKLATLQAAVESCCTMYGATSQLPAAWQAQLSAAKPNVKAALACFSEQRYARLATLASVPTARLPAKSKLSLSCVLRMSDVRYEELLSSLEQK